MAFFDSAERSDGLRSTTENIRAAFGAPSISCGVMHHGRLVFHHGEGIGNVERSLKPDLDTVYLVASCTKTFTTAACGILVDEGKLSWTEPVQAYIPTFKTKHDPEIGRRATLVDLCSHGTGLAPIDHSVAGFFDEFFHDDREEVSITASLPVAYDFRSRFLYNNNILGVVGHVIQEASGRSSSTYLRERIFEPLGLLRTSTS